MDVLKSDLNSCKRGENAVKRLTRKAIVEEGGNLPASVLGPKGAIKPKKVLNSKAEKPELKEKYSTQKETFNNNFTRILILEVLSFSSCFCTQENSSPSCP